MSPFDSSKNAPKGPDAKRDGVTTDPQSGSPTGAQPSGGSGPSTGAAATPITSPSQPAGTPPGTGDPKSAEKNRTTVGTVGKQSSEDNDTINLTQAQHGVPGQNDLTQGGSLNSDKSVRDSRSQEEKNEELNRHAGVNPTPNREGNEMTRAANGLANDPQMIMKIDRRTSELADDIRTIRGKSVLDESDKDKLAKLETELRQMGRL